MDTDKKNLITLYKSSTNKIKSDLLIDILFLLDTSKIKEMDVLNCKKKIHVYLVELLNNKDVKTLLNKYKSTTESNLLIQFYL